MKKTAVIITKSARATKKFGEIFAKEILEKKAGSRSLVIALVGDLGCGKTTFLQGFARGLGIKERVLSPTFILVKRFQLNSLTMKQFNDFYHIDCYRLGKPKELSQLGFKEIIFNPRNIVAIEWADKVKKTMPPKAIWVKFRFVDKNKRKIVVLK
ncbi:MAG: tRNA (adenosine(37)-N6)-threonylcarbamoyltransferase complex ATPase subunit type 1 TsaE [Candidatus Nealsonbacteria bacterium]|nr:tRNA (adenosine(37)-N6)-threonylcarbamoyltransferase complex ATPase subunit type 1 TsaE [Candidatus Nealsonbacteria bacterium]